jgi:hypothetical protein
MTTICNPMFLDTIVRLSQLALIAFGIKSLSPILYHWLNLRYENVGYFLPKKIQHIEQLVDAIRKAGYNVDPTSLTHITQSDSPSPI